MAALASFGRGDFEAAATSMATFAFPAASGSKDLPGFAVLDSAVLGNSAEQRDVLDEVYVLALMLSGRTGDAMAMSQNRTRVRVIRVYDAISLPLCFQSARTE